MTTLGLAQVWPCKGGGVQDDRHDGHNTHPAPAPRAWCAAMMMADADAVADAPSPQGPDPCEGILVDGSLGPGYIASRGYRSLRLDHAQEHAFWAALHFEFGEEGGGVPRVRSVEGRSPRAPGRLRASLSVEGDAVRVTTKHSRDEAFWCTVQIPLAWLRACATEEEDA